jgi:hypothetical protein
MNAKPESNHDGHFEYGLIKDISGARGSGLWQVYFEDGRYCHIEANGLRVMDRVYGGLENAIGKVIKYKTEDLNIMTCFGLVENLADDLFQE